MDNLARKDDVQATLNLLPHSEEHVSMNCSRDAFFKVISPGDC